MNFNPFPAEGCTFLRILRNPKSCVCNVFFSERSPDENLALQQLFCRKWYNPAEGRTFLRILRNPKPSVCHVFVTVLPMALFLDRWRFFNNHGERNATVASQVVNICMSKLWTCALSMGFSVNGSIFLEGFSEAFIEITEHSDSLIVENHWLNCQNKENFEIMS